MVGRWCALGVAAAMAVGAAACSGGGGQAAPPPTEASTTTTTSPPSTALTDEQAVLAAYQGYWDTWLAANDPPDPNHPDLAKYATGAALAKDIETITLHRSVGQRLRLPAQSISEHRAALVDIDGGRALVSDCSVDDGLLVANGSDFVIDDSIVTWRYEAVLVFDASWRVSELTVVERSDGVSGCAA